MLKRSDKNSSGSLGYYCFGDLGKLRSGKKEIQEEAGEIHEYKT